MEEAASRYARRKNPPLPVRHKALSLTIVSTAAMHPSLPRRVIHVMPSAYYPLPVFTQDQTYRCVASSDDVGQQQQSRGSLGPEFYQCRLTRSGSFGHRFEKFRLPHRFALAGRVNLPSPRFWWTTSVFDGESVVAPRILLAIGVHIKSGKYQFWMRCRDVTTSLPKGSERP